jgi:hypothetical protein
VELVDKGEIELAGGRQTTGLFRIGETVRRPLGQNYEFVHALLRHFEAVGFEGAPRLLGIDEHGREILTFIEGEVYAGPVTILTNRQLASAGRLIRGFNEATAGTVLAAGEEVVCHGDLGQHNIVFRGDEAVAIIDWDDDVRPGTRLVDLAHAVWCLAEVGEQGGEIDDQSRRIRLLCDPYDRLDRGAVVDEIEAGFKRARDRHRAAGRAEGARIFGEMVDWIVTYSPAIRARL